jgi:hypothetical protein
LFDGRSEWLDFVHTLKKTGMYTQHTYKRGSSLGLVISYVATKVEKRAREENRCARTHATNIYVCMKLHFFEAWPHGYTNARMDGRSAKSAMGAAVLDASIDGDYETYGVMVRPSRCPVILYHTGIRFSVEINRLKKHDPDHRSVPHVDMISASRQPVKQGGGMPVVSVMTGGGQRRDDSKRYNRARRARNLEGVPHSEESCVLRGGWGTDGIDRGLRRPLAGETVSSHKNRASSGWFCFREGRVGS